MVWTNKKDGFTLVEMLVALFILSATTLFVTVVVGTSKGTRDAVHENIAFRVAESKLNELRAGGYASLPSSGSFSDSQLLSVPEGTASTSITIWNAQTKKVVAGVSWLGSDGRTRFVSLETLITEVGGL